MPCLSTIPPSSVCIDHRRYHIYVLAAFLTVIMTYFGVNYFMVGMHSYAIVRV